jgi:hypothetical protein
MKTPLRRQWQMADGKGTDALHAKARKARIEWQNALAKQDYIQIESLIPNDDGIPEAKLPDDCKLIQRSMDLRSRDQKYWKKAVGAYIYDPETSSPLNTITVKFHFADGTTRQGSMTDRGMTWVPEKSGVAVTNVQMALEHKGITYERNIAIAATNRGIIFITFPIVKLVDRPFTEMRLQIDDKDILSFEGKGEYIRTASFPK